MFHYKGEDELKFSVRDQSGSYGREWGLCCDVVIRTRFFLREFFRDARDIWKILQSSFVTIEQVLLFSFPTSRNSDYVSSKLSENDSRLSAKIAFFL